MGNAVKLQNMNCSIVVKNKNQLKTALRTIEEEKRVFRESVEKLNKVSNRLNGLERATEIIEETIR
jgi:hypothetical protein